MNTILKTIERAAELHQKQFRKGERKLPYISHPFGVAFLLAKYTDDENIIIASLLHDVLEDVPGYYLSDMITEFGEVVTSYVEEVSEQKDPNVPTDKKQDWEFRKVKYLEHLSTASEGALLICAADKLHNLITKFRDFNTYGTDMWLRFNAGKEQQQWYYNGILTVLKQKLNNPIVAELESVLTEAQVMFA